jgi:putative oxidoreductase
MTKADDEMLDLQNPSLRIDERWREWAPLGLRLVIGYGFMAHGLAKLIRGPERFAAVLDWMHVPFSHFMAWFTTWVEILGGLAILVGAFVTLVTVPLIIIHLVAIFGVHLKYGFSSVNTIGLTADGPQFGPPGFEVNLLYIAGLLAIVLCGGAGRWSLDRALAHRSQRGHSLND